MCLINLQVVNLHLYIKFSFDLETLVSVLTSHLDPSSSSCEASMFNSSEEVDFCLRNFVLEFEVGLDRISLTSVGKVGLELEGWVNWRVLFDLEWSKDTSAVILLPDALETLEINPWGFQKPIRCLDKHHFMWTISKATVGCVRISEPNYD